jgi:hypothetical protein
MSAPIVLSENSSVDRWAWLVVELLEAETDPTTFKHWAQEVSMSVGSLRQACRVAGVGGKQSLDLARLLRAVVWLEDHDWLPEAVLSCRDPRTLKALFRRMGCGDGREPLQAEDFLERQTVLDRNGPHLMALRRALIENSDRNSGTR